MLSDISMVDMQSAATAGWVAAMGPIVSSGQRVNVAPVEGDTISGQAVVLNVVDRDIRTGERFVKVAFNPSCIERVVSSTRLSVIA